MGYALSETSLECISKFSSGTLHKTSRQTGCPSQQRSWYKRASLWLLAKKKAWLVLEGRRLAKERTILPPTARPGWKNGYASPGHGDRHVTFAGVEDGPSSHAPAEDPAATPRAGALRKRGDQLSVVETPLRKDRIKEEPISVDSDVEVVRERKSKKKKKKPEAVGETLALISPDKERQTREEETNGEESVRRPRQEAESEEDEVKQRREFARGFERRLVEPVAATSSQKEVDERIGSVYKVLVAQAAEQLAQEGLDQDPALDGRATGSKVTRTTRVEAVVGSEEQGCKRASHAGESPPHILLAAMRHQKQVEKAGGKGSWGRSQNWQ